MTIEEDIESIDQDVATLKECLKAQEKRTAKLERELDRLWEVIRCIGEK